MALGIINGNAASGKTTASFVVILFILKHTNLNVTYVSLDEVDAELTYDQIYDMCQREGITNLPNRLNYYYLQPANMYDILNLATLRGDVIFIDSFRSLLGAPGILGKGGFNLSFIFATTKIDKIMSIFNKFVIAVLNPTEDSTNKGQAFKRLEGGPLFTADLDAHDPYVKNGNITTLSDLNSAGFRKGEILLASRISTPFTPERSIYPVQASRSFEIDEEGNVVYNNFVRYLQLVIEQLPSWYEASQRKILMQYAVELLNVSPSVPVTETSIINDLESEMALNVTPSQLRFYLPLNAIKRAKRNDTILSHEVKGLDRFVNPNILKVLGNELTVVDFKVLENENSTYNVPITLSSPFAVDANKYRKQTAKGGLQVRVGAPVSMQLEGYSLRVKFSFNGMTRAYDVYRDGNIFTLYRPADNKRPKEIYSVGKTVDSACKYLSEFALRESQIMQRKLSIIESIIQAYGNYAESIGVELANITSFADLQDALANYENNRNSRSVVTIDGFSYDITGLRSAYASNNYAEIANILKPYLFRKAVMSLGFKYTDAQSAIPEDLYDSGNSNE